MKRPPLWMRLRFDDGNRKFGLWLPLFLLLPLALVVMIILSPLILVAILVLWPSGWGKRALLILTTAFRVFGSLRGLQVDVQDRHQCVYISII